MKKNIDYSKLKLDFFTSEYNEVKPFITETKGKRNGNLQKITKGRAKEKEDYKLAILNKTLEDNKEEMEERLKVRLKKMDDLYIKLTNKLETKLEEDLTIKELYDLWKIIRVEKGLTTNITKDPENEAKIQEKLEGIKINLINYRDERTILNESDFIQD